ncbi:uncharacterized protein [Pocillopora verrucosa]|uniref:uncharacterized protein isoform X2 n=1 Tax=Pocillopora verrucosa TaxID=203993 RepID=UPI00334291E2
MKCSNCGDTRLQPGFHFCPGCGSIQEDGQNNQPKEQKIVPAVTSEHPKGDGTGEKHDTGASKEQVKGESLQQNGTNTEITQKNSSFNLQLEPMQVPNNGFSTSPVQQEEGAAQESLRTLATTDPDNKDFGRVEEIATKAGSAAVTNTPERAETDERQREDIALEQKVDTKGKGEEKEGSTHQHQSSMPPNLQQATSEAGVTVVFYVLVSSVSEMTDGKLSIQASGVKFGHSKCSCVELRAVDRPSKRSEKDYFQRFQGQLELTLDQAREVTGYSYVKIIGEKIFPENFNQF